MRKAPAVSVTNPCGSSPTGTVCVASHPGEIDHRHGVTPAVAHVLSASGLSARPNGYGPTFTLTPSPSANDEDFVRVLTRDEEPHPSLSKGGRWAICTGRLRELHTKPSCFHPSNGRNSSGRRRKPGQSVPTAPTAPDHSCQLKNRRYLPAGFCDRSAPCSDFTWNHDIVAGLPHSITVPGSGASSFSRDAQHPLVPLRTRIQRVMVWRILPWPSSSSSSGCLRAARQGGPWVRPELHPAPLS